MGVTRLVATISIFVLGVSVVGVSTAISSAAQPGPRITIRAASEITSPEGLNNKVLDQFKAEVEKASGGRIMPELYKGTLGIGKELMEGLVLGSNQVVVVEKSLLTAYVPAVGALSLPYVFKGREHINKTLRDSEVGRTLEQRAAAKGIAILGWFAYAPRALATNRSVRQVSDMAGLKVRIMNDPVMLNTYQAEGAAPVPIAWPETYLAMSQGTVDAVDTTVSDGRDSKLNEVAKYLSLNNTFYSIAGIYVSKRWFDGLPPDLQKIVSDAAKTAARYADTEEPKLYESALRDWAKTSEILRQDLSGFRQAAAKIYPLYHEKFGKDIIDGILKLGEQYQ
jgi:tripartite ATP-independent transporter DctP family solute receptor